MNSEPMIRSIQTRAGTLFESYDRHKHTEILSRRLKHADLMRWLHPFHDRKIVEMETAGRSAEGRPIPLVRYGDGPAKVLLWSQMHGDEPTATMAMVDMLNYFATSPDDATARLIRDNLTILMIPMLNPDGAERFQRRTAQGIDMNRDALRLETPEARILREVHAAHKPAFGFNLHDQDPRLTVGTSTKVTAIALLAPAADEAKTDTPSRQQAKLVAAVFAETMKAFVAEHVARYDDTFEPRAFGDNIQRWGTSTVLVESGGWPNDRDKMFLRRLNYVGLLTSLAAIADGTFDQARLTDYEMLPFNGENLYDIIVRKARFVANDRTPPATVDIGINLEEKLDEVTGSIELVGTVVDIGDLSTFGAFRELNGSNLSLNGSELRLEKTVPLSALEHLLRTDRLA
jgi:hypothetical protein